MFSGYLLNTWTVATIAAVVAGVVGFFIVLRGSAFVADAVPQGAFAGAAGASLLGINTLIGLASSRSSGRWASAGSAAAAATTWRPPWPWW